MNPQVVRLAQVSLTLALAASAHAQIPTAGRSAPLPQPQADIKTVAINALSRPAPARAPTATAHPSQVGPKSAGVAMPQSALSSDHSRMYFDTDAAGAVWARGADYKMRFDTGGAAYVPFFGSNAPRNFELSLALTSVSVGATELELDTHARPQRSDGAVTLDRGDVSEVYQLDLHSVEQKFVLSTLPAAGDIHLRVAFTSELVAVADSTGFRFENEYGYVHYGRATAIDALGHTLQLNSELVGGAIDIRVPADFAARAALPLVIDPILFEYSVESGAIASLQPDVVYDWSGGYAMHCWEEVFSVTDHDVYSVICDIYGIPIGGTAAYVDYTGANWARPRCAYNAVSDRYMFTAEVGVAGSRTIWGQIRGPYFGFDTGQFMVSDPNDSGEKLNADVGGDPYMGPSYFLVVYERVYASNDRDIHARLVDGNGVPASTIYVDNSGGTIDTAPSISKTNDANNWNIAWQRQTSATAHDVWCARVFWQGSITSSPFAIATDIHDESSPSVSSSMSGTQRFVVAYEFDYSGFFTPDHDIILALIDGSTLIGVYDLSTAEGANYAQDQRSPAIDCDGIHFACAYSELFGSSTTDFDAFVTEVAVSGNAFALIEGHHNLWNSYCPDIDIAIASRRSSTQSGATAQYVASWSVRAASCGFADDIRAATYSGSNGGPVSAFCFGTSATCPCSNSLDNGYGCSNSVYAYGAYLFAPGNASTTSDTLTMQYGEMPAGINALLFQGLNVINNGYGNPFGDGIRCVGAPVFRFPIRTTNASGYAQYGYNSGDVPISVRGGIPAAGVVAYYQVWYRDTATFCTAKTTNFTNALKVAWTP